MNTHLLCCDWGTSSLRLRLIDQQDGKVLGEHLAGEGIAAVFDAWKNDGNKISKEDFFRQYLKKIIEAMSLQTKLDLTDVHLIISGMASSSIGMHQLPYAVLPFALDGKNALVKTICADEQFPYNTTLISGVRNDHNAMRGEETQLIGLADLVNIPAAAKEAIFIFPGTHSKHVYLQQGQLVNFETYMTGELFHLMSTHSILKDSIDVSSLDELSTENKEAFELGLTESADNGIMKSLFTVRTNLLFQRLNKKQNTHYLSGVLIGAELQPLIEKKDSVLILCSGSNLYSFYTKAIEAMGLMGSTIVVPGEVIDKAYVIGQMKIFKHNLSVAN